jgi:hypothetical protein
MGIFARHSVVYLFIDDASHSLNTKHLFCSGFDTDQPNIWEEWPVESEGGRL